MHRDFWAERRKPMRSTAQPKEAACDTPFNGLFGPFSWLSSWDGWLEVDPVAARPVSPCYKQQ